MLTAAARNAHAVSHLTSVREVVLTDGTFQICMAALSISPPNSSPSNVIQKVCRPMYQIVPLCQRQALSRSLRESLGVYTWQFHHTREMILQRNLQS